jgi:acyl-CoA oxidase
MPCQLLPLGGPPAAGQPAAGSQPALAGCRNNKAIRQRQQEPPGRRVVLPPMPARQRLRALRAHVSTKASSSHASSSLATTATATVGAGAAASHGVDVAALRRALRDATREEVRHKTFEQFAERSYLLPAHGLSKEQHRAICLRALLETQGPGAEVQAMDLMLNDPALYYEMGAAMHCVDLSLAIKSGVQFTLWGGSVMNLGTERHHAKYRDAIADVSLPGCFAMTELEHGSNVGAIGTKAVYDASTEEFVVHTPTDGATKWWIGNAANDGRCATVFAQLYSLGQNHGVHALIVPLRDEEGRVLPGVGIRDCGVKVGLNGANEHI